MQKNIPLVLSSSVAICLHLLIFLFITFTSPLSSNPKPKKLHVTTLRLQPEVKIQQIAASEVFPEKPTLITPTIAPPKPAPAKPAKTPPSPAPPPAPPKKESKKPVKKEIPKPSLPVEQAKTTTINSKKNELLAKAQESLKKITNEKQSTFSPSTKSAAPEIESEAELAYKDELASFLKLLLRLPEIGDINLKLTIAKNGNIKKIEILSSESSSNRKYVEKILPQHTMPPLGKQFGAVDAHTFTITMKSSL